MQGISGHGGAGLTARLPGLQHLVERVERQILATGLSNAGDLESSVSWGHLLRS
jgi:hypothetical protein